MNIISEKIDFFNTVMMPQLFKTIQSYHINTGDKMATLIHTRIISSEHWECDRAKDWYPNILLNYPHDFHNFSCCVYEICIRFWKYCNSRNYNLFACSNLYNWGSLYLKK